MSFHTVTITPRPGAAEADVRPYLWGRNRYALLARVEAWALQGTPEVRGLVGLQAYSKRSDDSPCHLSYLSPDDARAIARALLAAADAAEEAPR